MTTLAIKLTTRTTEGLSGADVVNVLQHHAKQNADRVLFTTNLKLAASKRPHITEVLLYENEHRGYLVNISAVGLGFPEETTPVPEGYTSPKIWATEQRNTWMCLEGEFTEVTPSNYMLDSREELLTETFSGRPSMAYVHNTDA